MMQDLIIQGGRQLAGSISVYGNKNAALPMLAASVLTDEPVELRNVPGIDDVRVMLELLADLGVEVQHRGHRVRLCAAGLRSTRLDPDLCRRVRSSILLAGPLAARHGSARLFPPGGDVIGRRRLDTHFAGLQALGMQIRTGRSFQVVRDQLRGAYILLDEASVTATEHIMMAAVLTPGTTTLYHAACEPHVEDLGRLLIRMGARIEGLGTNRLTIRGVRRLHGAVHTVGPDYIELGSFLAAGAITGGSLSFTMPPGPDIQAVLSRPFRRLGVQWQQDGRRARLTARQSLVIEQDLNGAIPTIEDGTWPAIPSDLLSVMIVLATQSTGTLLFFEKLFESRMYFVDQLISMGARIVQCDPHRVLVSGPCSLHGSRMASPDIRAGMALVVAALAAKGQSRIQNAAMIDRGYERIDDRLRALGADIERTC